MRFALSLALLSLLAAPLAGQAPKKKAVKPADPDKAVTGASALPRGWTARTDKKGSEAAIKFITMDPGYHFTLGPAAIFWRTGDKDRQDGPFHTVATFTQTKAPEHPEGYGVFVGGQGLDGDGVRYTYFLVRGDGSYLIKRRDGEGTTNITSDWTAHPAIQKADTQGRAMNRLEITIGRDKTSFVVNGKEVYAADPRLIDGKGIVGLRINHNLDVHVEDFAVHKM